MCTPSFDEFAPFQSIVSQNLEKIHTKIFHLSLMANAPRSNRQWKTTEGIRIERSRRLSAAGPALARGIRPRDARSD